MKLHLKELASALRRNAFPLIVSAWIAVVYAERIVVHKVVWGPYKGFIAAINDAAVVLSFLLCWVLILWAMVLQKEQMTEWQSKAKQFLKKVYKDVKFPWVSVLTVAVLFLVALGKGTIYGQTFVKALEKWWKPALKFVAEQGAAITVLLSIALIYMILRMIYKFLQGKTEVNKAGQEWVIGSFFVYLAWIAYMLIYYLTPWPGLHDVGDNTKWYFVRGLIKDSFLYTFFAVFLVNGMYRFGCCADNIKGIGKWIVFAIFAGFAVIIAIALLAMDAFYTDQIHKIGAIEYPSETQRNLIVKHITIRDWFILVPLVILIFTWLFKKVVTASAKEAKK